MYILCIQIFFHMHATVALNEYCMHAYNFTTWYNTVYTSNRILDRSLKPQRNSSS